MIRLLAFDLDGTTMTEHKYISERNRRALIRAAERGVLLVPATGRMRSFLPEEVLSLPSVRYVITSNGAAVYDLQRDEAILQRLIDNAKARQVQNFLDGYNVYVEYYRNGQAITRTGYPELAFTHFGVPESRRHFIDGKVYDFTDDLGEMLGETGLCPEKINLPYVPEAVRQEIWQGVDALGGLRLTSSLPGNIEINSAAANKGAVLLELAELLGVDRREIMAIGDNGNDVTMLEAAGCSVAVADGAPEALEAARYHTAAHNEDGVAEAIERLLLGEERP